jgi:two-component system, sensor histidine kinase YesM
VERKHNAGNRQGRVSGMLRRLTIKRRMALVWAVLLLLLTLALAGMLQLSIISYEAYVSLRGAQLNGTVGEGISAGLTSLLAVTKYPVIQVSQRPTDTYNYLSYPDRYKKTIMYADLEYRSTFLFEQNRDIRLIAVFDREGSGSYVKNSKKYTYQLSPNQQPLEEKGIAAEQWFIDTLSAKGSPLVWPAGKVPLHSIYLPDKEGMLFVSRAIMSLETFRPLGVILAAVDVSGSVMRYQQGKLFPQQQMGFISSDGTLLAGDLSPAGVGAFLQVAAGGLESRDNASFRTAADGQDSLYNYAQSINGYYCVLETPYWQVLVNVFKQRLATFIALGLGCIFVSLGINAIFHSIVRPVKRLADTCNTIVLKEDFSVAIDDPYRDELSELTGSFNAMTSRIQYLIHNVYEKEMELSKSTLQLLRSQVNPHFLYNTLETIRIKAYLLGQSELSDMAMLLASILRYGLSAPSEMVTVEAETSKLSEYLTLQRYLYSDRFQASVNIEPEILKLKMMKFILQPLVENALNHGFQAIQTSGTLEVLGYRDGDDIIFKVIDNGGGIHEDTLHDLVEYMENGNTKFSSIGLKNVHRRIRLLYGDAYGVTITSQVNVGTMVSVRIPAIA